MRVDRGGCLRYVRVAWLPIAWLGLGVRVRVKVRVRATVRHGSPLPVPTAYELLPYLENLESGEGWG